MIETLTCIYELGIPLNSHVKRRSLNIVRENSMSLYRPLMTRNRFGLNLRKMTYKPNRPGKISNEEGRRHLESLFKEGRGRGCRCRRGKR